MVEVPTSAQVTPRRSTADAEGRADLPPTLTVAPKLGVPP